MSWEQGTATSYTDLLNKLSAFLLKGHALKPIYAGTGTGLITLLIGTASSVQETVTVTFSSSTAFSVVGSVSGSLGSGTVGTAFTCSVCAFTITAGGTAWVSGDTISFVMTRPWEALRSVAGSEMIWKAPGNAGLDEIIVGAKTFFNDTGDYYNWWLMGATAYSSGASFSGQPGAHSSNVLPLWNASIPYWFVASGKRVIIIAKVSSVYEMAYLGFPDTYMSPGQFPYPVFIGGAMQWNALADTVPDAISPNWRWSYQGNAHRAFWYPRSVTSQPQQAPASTAQLRRPDGSWRPFVSNIAAGIASIWPYTEINGAPSSCANMKPNLDGSYPLLPIILWDDLGSSVYNVYGELEGISWTTGDSIGSEYIITVGRESHLVLQNIYKTTVSDYCAVLLA